MENSNKEEVHFNTSKNIIYQFNNNEPMIPLNNNQFNSNQSSEIIIDNFLKNIRDNINIRKICVDKINDELKYIDKEIIKKLNIESLPQDIINLGDEISFKDKLIIRQNFINSFIHKTLYNIFTSVLSENVLNYNLKLEMIDDRIEEKLNLNYFMMII